MARWLKLSKCTNRHLKRYNRMYDGLAFLEIGRWEGVSWMNWLEPPNPKLTARHINRFTRRNGH